MGGPPLLTAHSVGSASSDTAHRCRAHLFLVLLSSCAQPCGRGGHVTYPWGHRPRTFRVARVPAGVSLSLSFCGAASPPRLLPQTGAPGFPGGGNPSTKFHNPGMYQVSWHLWAHRTVLPLGPGKEEKWEKLDASHCSLQRVMSNQVHQLQKRHPWIPSPRISTRSPASGTEGDVSACRTRIGELWVGFQITVIIRLSGKST